jgi:hypothetical protein
VGKKIRDAATMKTPWTVVIGGKEAEGGDIQVKVFVADTYLESGNFAIGSAFLTVFFGIAGLVLVLLGINLYMLGKMLEDGKA